MTNPPQNPIDQQVQETSVPSHYQALTVPMVKYSGGGDLHSFHFGLWGPDTASHHESLLRANQTLTEGCSLEPGKRILDSGCGIGGTAIWLAKTYGVQAIGLTNCEPHVEVATKLAEQRGVGDLVEFHYGDFMNMPFPDSCFDAVLNQESFCYAPDKLAYLQGVHRILKPDGRWQALEGLLSGASMSEAHEAVHASMQWGFRMPPLMSWHDACATLEKAGFEEIQEKDLSAEAARSTELTRQFWSWFGFLSPPPPGPDLAYHECMGAGLDFDTGLQEGVFTYHFLSGKKPIEEPDRY